MLRINKIRIYNGTLFDTEKEAKQRLDKIYGDKLLKLSHNIARDTDMMFKKLPEFIDDNLDRFLELKAIKNDMVLMQDDD